MEIEDDSKLSPSSNPTQNEEETKPSSPSSLSPPINTSSLCGYEDLLGIFGLLEADARYNNQESVQKSLEQYVQHLPGRNYKLKMDQPLSLDLMNTIRPFANQEPPERVMFGDVENRHFLRTLNFSNGEKLGVVCIPCWGALYIAV